MNELRACLLACLADCLSPLSAQTLQRDDRYPGPADSYSSYHHRRDKPVVDQYRAGRGIGRGEREMECVCVCVCVWFRSAIRCLFPPFFPCAH